MNDMYAHVSVRILEKEYQVVVQRQLRQYQSFWEEFERIWFEMEKLEPLTPITNDEEVELPRTSPNIHSSTP